MNRFPPLACLAVLLLSASAFAAERVEEEEIVLQDPTVAAPKKWTVGASGEGWIVAGPYNNYDQNGNKTTNGYISGGMPGGNFFIGWDALTLQYSYRGGTFKFNETFTSNGATYLGTQNQVENEVTLRYLFKLSPNFNPYLIMGYNGTNLKDVDTLNGGFVWTYNGSKQYSAKTSYNSFLFGVGAIVPFNKYFGMRADGRLMSAQGNYLRDDGFKATGSGVGGAAVATMYVNVYEGINLQAGFKAEGFNFTTTGVPGFFRVGGFGSLGYSYKF